MSITSINIFPGFLPFSHGSAWQVGELLTHSGIIFGRKSNYTILTLIIPKADQNTQNVYGHLLGSFEK